MIVDQPPTDLLQSALDHAYARGWHDGFVAGRHEESARAKERIQSVEACAERIAALTEALRYYADNDTTVFRRVMNPDNIAFSVRDDRGERARAALARYTGEGETTE